MIHHDHDNQKQHLFHMQQKGYQQGMDNHWERKEGHQPPDQALFQEHNSIEHTYSGRKNRRYLEAYLFKGNSYVILYFTPGQTKDYIITGPKEFLPYWPSLKNILPRDNVGLDIYEGPGPDPERGHDEL
nr:putative hemopexin-like domain-containing protein [Tanacetum cinerariifolium]